jgi:hypothetical protein
MMMRDGDLRQELVPEFAALMAAIQKGGGDAADAACAEIQAALNDVDFADGLIEETDLWWQPEFTVAIRLLDEDGKQRPVLCIFLGVESPWDAPRSGYYPSVLVLDPTDGAHGFGDFDECTEVVSYVLYWSFEWEYWSADLGSLLEFGVKYDWLQTKLTPR